MNVTKFIGFSLLTLLLGWTIAMLASSPGTSLYGMKSAFEQMGYLHIMMLQELWSQTPPDLHSLWGLLSCLQLLLTLLGAATFWAILVAWRRNWHNDVGY